MSDWRDRLKETIVFNSPNGNSFEAKWRGDERSIQKRIGEFGFPGRSGSIVQDLGSKAARYPLTIYFDGADNDLNAARFFDAVYNEKGPWLVGHPIYGTIELQPVSVTEKAQPVESGNITEISSEWVETLNEETLETTRQMWAEINELQKDANGAAIEDFTRDDEEAA